MSTEPKTVLLATDATAASDGARAAAAQLCRRGGAALHVVHVQSPWMSLTPGESSAQQAWALAANERRVIEDELGCRVAAVHLPHGFSAAAIVATAKAAGADLVVVGGRHLRLLDELFTDHVSRAVVDASPFPVLMVPGESGGWPPRHVVVGCDGSEESRHAARLGGWLAGLTGADVVVAGVADADAPEVVPTLAGATRLAAQCAAELSAASRVQHVVIRVTTADAVAPALRRVCDEAGGPCVLAVGARGSGALRRAGNASVSNALLQHPHTAMLLVPPALLGRTRTQPSLHVQSR